LSEKQDVNKLIQDGLAALKKNKNAIALELFDLVLKLSPKNTMAMNNKGVALRKMGRIKEAIDCYNEALKYDPKLSMALLNKARALKVQQKFDLALFTYEDILEIQPEHPLALEESERVRNLLSRRAHLKLEGFEQEALNKEKELLEEQKEELLDFFEESKRSISDSVEKIAELFEMENHIEAEKHRTKISQAIVSFNDQIYNRILTISQEFSTIDFEEECRELIDNWQVFKENKLAELENMKLKTYSQ